MTVNLVYETCSNCGTPFGIEQCLYNNLRKTKAIFYCPNGHGQSYTQSEAERLKIELERTQRELTQSEYEARRNERRRAAAEGKLTKFKNKIKNGFCPLCEKEFATLAKHMIESHPEFGNEERPDDDG